MLRLEDALLRVVAAFEQVVPNVIQTALDDIRARPLIPLLLHRRLTRTRRNESPGLDTWLPF